jgi:hypothetical protein
MLSNICLSKKNVLADFRGLCGMGAYLLDHAHGSSARKPQCYDAPAPPVLSPILSTSTFAEATFPNHGERTLHLKELIDSSPPLALLVVGMAGWGRHLLTNSRSVISELGIATCILDLSLLGQSMDLLALRRLRTMDALQSGGAAQVPEL